MKQSQASGELTALNVSGAKKHYGSRCLFEDLNLQCGRGERVAILGPSGCGKSTLLKLIAGVEVADAGTLMVAGQPNTRETLVREISYLSQRPTLLPWLSVIENVLLPIRLSRSIVDADKDQARRLLTAFDVLEAAHLRPSQISGGMRQRAALAQSLIVPGSLLLLDEPFSALDDITRRSVLTELAQWLDSDGRSLLVVTHSFEDAAFLADRVIFWKPERDGLGASLIEQRTGREFRQENADLSATFMNPAFSELREDLFFRYRAFQEHRLTSSVAMSQ